MPTAGPRICGCGALVPGGERCRRCVASYDRKRGSASARGYGTDWRALRASVPHAPCAGAGCGAPWAPSHHLDHVKPRRQGGTDDPSNLQWLCRRCHASKTARQDGGFGREAQGGPGRSAAPAAAPTPTPAPGASPRPGAAPSTAEGGGGFEVQAGSRRPSQPFLPETKELSKFDRGGR